jgi:hypothetical protein
VNTVALAPLPWEPWRVVGKFTPEAAAMADRHYSRRKVGSPQFMPPGETLVLLAEQALFGWWRPHPDSGITSMNGLDGWTCTIFRNESVIRSSNLILAAEVALRDVKQQCGPDGMLTYVFDSRIRSVNPGCCFKKAGWRVRGRSADGRKTLLHKPFAYLAKVGR